MSNFEFLKKVDKDLYDIVFDAEKLYRDEYFEQCMTQTRRFAEVVTQNILKNTNSLNSENATFDEMINCLKDKSKNNPREKEFIDDLYFLKKNGNKSAHSKKVQQSGITALECLQRAFEVAINYFISINGEDKKILGLNFDIDLLITGKKSKKNLSEKYISQKEKSKKITKIQNGTVFAKSGKKQLRQQTAYKVSDKKEEISLFKKIFYTLVASVVLLLIYMFYKLFV